MEKTFEFAGKTIDVDYFIKFYHILKNDVCAVNSLIKINSLENNISFLNNFAKTDEITDEVINCHSYFRQFGVDDVLLSDSLVSILNFKKELDKNLDEISSTPQENDLYKDLIYLSDKINSNIIFVYSGLSKKDKVSASYIESLFSQNRLLETNISMTQKEEKLSLGSLDAYIIFNNIMQNIFNNSDKKVIVEGHNHSSHPVLGSIYSLNITNQIIKSNNMGNSGTGVSSNKELVESLGGLYNEETKNNIYTTNIKFKVL